MTKLRVAFRNFARRLQKFPHSRTEDGAGYFRKATHESLYRNVGGVNCADCEVHINTLTVSTKFEFSVRDLVVNIGNTRL